MGLNVSVCKRNKASMDDLVDLCNFRKFYAFQYHVKTHCKSNVLSQDDLQTLAQTLERLDADNCMELFPNTSIFDDSDDVDSNPAHEENLVQRTYTRSFDELYWNNVHRLQVFLNVLLRETDFTKDDIYFFEC